MNAPGIWIVRPAARPLAERLRQELGGVIHPRTRDGRGSNRELFRQTYPRRRAWVLIMSCGIAVRYLDGLTRDKRTDPAAVVLDEAGRHAVALLGGHEAGANALAYAVARSVGAEPVVTTASEALKPLVLGIGCRRATPARAIATAAQQVLKSAGRRLDEVREVATIDLKADEPGLLEWVARAGLALRIFRRRDLAARAPWAGPGSEHVRCVVGAPGVCEPCALMACARGGLIVPKTSIDGVTIAVAEDDGWRGEGVGR